MNEVLKSEETIKDDNEFNNNYNEVFNKDNLELVSTNEHKDNFIKLLIFIILIICLSIVGYRFLRYRYQQKSLKQYQIIMENTHVELLKIKEEEAEIQRIKAEEELKQKMANRNINNLTQEQMDKINNIYTVGSEKIAYITFDDGPSATVTPLILDILKQENIKATFFVLGNNARWYPEILKRIRQEGHYIANHGYTHKYNEIYSSYESLINEYNLCEQAIKNSLEDQNYKTRIFRFPGGSNGGKYHNMKQESKTKLQQEGIIFLDWNALTGDSEGIPTKESIMQKLIETTQNKNTVVILMHDAGSKILTYETLPDVIKYLKEQGYTFGDIYDVIGE